MEEKIFKGIAISGGTVIGTPFYLLGFEEKVFEVSIEEDEVQKEIERYHLAIYRTRVDLNRLKKAFEKEGDTSVVDILNAHISLLADPLITNVIEEKIRNLKKNTEAIFKHVLLEYKKHFNEFGDVIISERMSDIIDVSQRILRNLGHFHNSSVKYIPENSIVLSPEIAPSDTAEASFSKIKAFVTKGGGHTSHTAIIARAKNIPYVANIDIDVLKEHVFKTMIVDANKGKIIINPKEQTLVKYRKLIKSNDFFINYPKKVSLPAKTKDGTFIRISGNIEMLKDVDLLIQHQGSGIGLFRSEFLFLTDSIFPTKERQFDIYSDLVKKMDNRPVVIRLFDMGGDKNHIFFYWKSCSEYHEMNPSLGCRAIRFLMRNKKILKDQICAIVKASSYGDVRILIPLVSDISEFRYVKNLVEETQKELIAQNIDVASKIPIGCMIEVPASAIMSGIFAKESDFLSIGTNDLSQYILAVDRNNPQMNDINSMEHPSVFRMLHYIVRETKKYNKPLSICGEMAANPKFTALLLGLGICEFSVSPSHIPLVKHSIGSVHLDQAKKLLAQVLQISSSEEFKIFLDKIFKY